MTIIWILLFVLEGEDQSNIIDGVFHTEEQCISRGTDVTKNQEAIVSYKCLRRRVEGEAPTSEG